MKFRSPLSWAVFLLPAIGWFFWSFILTDRSLLYSATSLFVAFQNFFWQFADNRVLHTGLYAVLVGSLFVLYASMVRTISYGNIRVPKHAVLYIAVFYGFFIFSNPALSYDLFNYMFDAKLVVQYHLDPHVTSAYSFMGQDDWVRFMRNVFFPTTYGYMWTFLSLFPFVLGMGKLLLVFLSFKLFMALGLLTLFSLQRFILRRFSRKSVSQTYASLALFFLAPLVIIETLSSGHNDVWMMLFAFGSLSLLFFGNVAFDIEVKKSHKKLLTTGVRIAASFLLLYASSQIKRSTALLLPVWAVLAGGLLFPWLAIPTFARRIYILIASYWADISALLLFAPLFTELSRQFHPWYLLWSFSFIAFVKVKMLRILLLSFSVTSVLRYLPILSIGVYSDDILSVQKMITWSAVPFGLVVWSVLHMREKSQK